jgi:predicted aldo/keto reductase-like oxidoreductase
LSAEITGKGYHRDINKETNMHDGNKKYSRRNFIKTTALAGAAASVGGLPLKDLTAKDNPSKAESSKKEMIQRVLGRTDFRVPIISMGVMNANNPGVVSASFDRGVRHFDTAAYYQYGRNEQMLGRVVKDRKIREKVVISTKILTRRYRERLDPKDLLTELTVALDASLKRLQMDYIDILYIHSVTSAEDLKVEGIMEGLELAKKQGKVRAFGISTHLNMSDVIEEAIRSGFYDVVLTSYNVTMADDSRLREAIKNAAEKGIGIVAMKTLAGGTRLPNKEALNRYSSSTINLACLKWAMRNEYIATSIPGYDNYKHMEEDISVAYDLELTGEEQDFLAGNEVKIGLGFCQQCRDCVASCPKNVEIPELMRVYMYAAQYGNFEHARATLKDIPEDRNLHVCSSCSTCRVQCSNSVSIASRLETLHHIYG